MTTSRPHRPVFRTLALISALAFGLAAVNACSAETSDTTDTENLGHTEDALTGGLLGRDLFNLAGLGTARGAAEFTEGINVIFNTAGNAKQYYTVGTDRAKCIDTSMNQAKSESQSWCMMFSLWNGDKAKFDLLWRYARNNMRNTSGAFQGYFAWLMTPSDTISQAQPAPDGDILFAAALYSAHARWGSSGLENDQDYLFWANDIANTMMTAPAGNISMIDSSNRIVFTTMSWGTSFTDASYQMLPFLQIIANNVSANRSRWASVVGTARSQLQGAMAYNANGLVTDYMEFGGAPINCNGHGLGNCNSSCRPDQFRCDSPRAAIWAAADYVQNNGGAWESSSANAYTSFFAARRGTVSWPGDGVDYPPYWDTNTNQSQSPLTDSPLAVMAGVAAACAAVDFNGTNNCTQLVSDLANAPHVTDTWGYFHNQVMTYAKYIASGKTLDFSQPCSGAPAYLDSKAFPTQRIRENAGVLQLWPNTATRDFVKWYLTPAGNGWYYIQNKGDGARLLASGTTLSLAAAGTTGAGVEFRVLDSGVAGYYRLVTHQNTSTPWVNAASSTSLVLAGTGTNGDSTRWALTCQP